MELKPKRLGRAYEIKVLKYYFVLSSCSDMNDKDYDGLRFTLINISLVIFFDTQTVLNLVDFVKGLMVKRLLIIQAHLNTIF